MTICIVTVLQKLEDTITIYTNDDTTQWLQVIKCHQYDLINHYIMKQISTNVNLQKNSVNSSI